MSKIAGWDALLAVILDKTVGILLHTGVHVLACGGIFHTTIPVHGASCAAEDFILCIYLFQCLNNSRPFQRVGLHRIKVTPSQHRQKKIQKLNQRQKQVQRQEVLPIHQLVQSPHCSQQSPAWQDDPQCHRNHALPLVLVRSSSRQLFSPALGAVCVGFAGDTHCHIPNRS